MMPEDVLASAYERAANAGDTPVILHQDILERVRTVVRKKPQAALRTLLACLVAKVVQPHVDIRKPYTQIEGDDTYSGRYYDENYIARFLIDYDLPVIPTTGFLTPAYRAKNIILTPDVNLGGRSPGNRVYGAMLQLLTDVHTNRVSAIDLLVEVIRQLLLYRDESRQRLESLLASLEATKGDVPLSAEEIVTLIEQHLACKGSSRLPVRIVATAYRAAENHLNERVLPLETHTAADKQTGALGDVHIALIADDNIVTAYEMKARRVTREDIDLAVRKIAASDFRLDNYIFITTEPVSEVVGEYAKSVYDRLGIEMAILDCISFLRHFLHLFHRLRTDFLETYQELVIAEPESSVSQPLKEAFVALRRTAENRDEG
ncbi:MAG TPA: hypothetical protein VKY59_16635 [Spirillospora sp.]|nr:hypothetical protein [Spirillospora sp.]